MRWAYFTLFVFFVAGLTVLSRPSASDYVAFENNEAKVCPATANSSLPPDFSGSACKTVSEISIDPFRTKIWVQGRVASPALNEIGSRPIGLFVSAKAASHVYLNDQLLGQNGQPGLARDSEIAGQLDMAFYVPRQTFQSNGNTLTLLLSGQHSLVRTTPAILSIGFGPYRVAPFHGRNDYWISLLAFGVFLIGAVYFGASATLGTSTAASATLSIGSALAAIQLLLEVSRGFFTYLYPIHDVRQILICVLSLGVGLALVLHTLIRLAVPNRNQIFVFLILAVALGLAFVPGYERKASWLMFVPSITAGAIAFSIVRSNKQPALSYGFTFVLFSLLILLDPGQFLDSYYYLSLMVLIAILFVSQALTFRDARQEQLVIEAERAKLEVALANLTSAEPMYLQITATGKSEKISCQDIAVISSAGDYSAIRLLGGREVLQNESLKSLGRRLPDFFVFVHRSHIVNSQHVSELKRMPSGLGQLRLLDGHTVPVSRRVLPRIKKFIFDE